MAQEYADELVFNSQGERSGETRCGHFITQDISKEFQSCFSTFLTGWTHSNYETECTLNIHTRHAAEDCDLFIGVGMSALLHYGTVDNEFYQQSIEVKLVWMCLY
jgi:hypothetical protein